MNKRANEVIPGHVWEVTSLKLDGEEKLDAFYEDSCFCKRLTFTTETNIILNGIQYPNNYTVYFSDCNGKASWDEFPSLSAYSISLSTLKKRKYAFLGFHNYSNSDPTCTCGRFGFARYFTITDLDEKNETFTYSVDLPDGTWEVELKQI